MNSAPIALLGQGRHHLPRLVAVDHGHVESARPLLDDARLQVLPVRLGHGHVDRARQAQLEVGLQLVRKLLEEGEVGRGDRIDRLSGIGVHGRADTGHAPVATGSARGDPALLEDQHLAAGLGQAIGGRATGHAGSDDDDIMTMGGDGRHRTSLQDSARNDCGAWARWQYGAHYAGCGQVRRDRYGAGIG